ncbi:hypothetical protein [Streptomyces sp. bgisy027]|uniref:hypothetical protein n=1 Tax=unclassified Streptomyces TaxID=2593676 RepID=UPI003D706C91
MAKTTGAGAAFGHAQAVYGLYFQINEGESLCLVREAGCGKSTTGRQITRLARAARDILQPPGPVEGGLVDVTVYEADPRREPGVLRHPRRIVLRGRVVR